MRKQAAFEKVGECLYRNPSSGTYYAILKVKGKQLKESLKTKNLPEARRKLKDKRNEVFLTDQKSVKNTLAHYADVYLGAAKDRTDKPSKNKARMVELIKARWPGGSDRTIAKIKASEIRLFLETVGADFGWSYFNALLATVRNCFIAAYEDGAIAEIPGDRTKTKRDSPWKRKPATKPIRRTPTVEQFRAIVASIRSQQFADTREETADFVEAQGCLGLGQAELAALCWQSVDFQNNTIQVLRIKTNSPFFIPIYPQAKALIERRKKITGGNPEDHVFSIKDAKIAVSEACKRLNLPQFSQRSFRRMFITEALRKGVNVKVISELQGHRDGGKLILQTYSDIINADEKQAAAQAIAKAFSDSAKEAA